MGTAQFGMPYGITNSAGQVPERGVGRILSLAADAGISFIDTASLYGASEAVLGRTLPVDHGFSIITKTPRFDPSHGPDQTKAGFLRAFERSLSDLRQPTLYGLLAQDADNLLGPCGDVLWRQMAALKSSGQIEKIGASVYHGAQIDGLLRRFDLDIVQIPINVLDRRLIEGGQIARLASRRVEIHARSVFLQGLLLSDPNKIDPRFGMLRQHIAGLHRAFAEAGISLLEGTLHAVLEISEIAVVTVGATSAAELREIIEAYRRTAWPMPSISLKEWALDDINILDPSRWMASTGGGGSDIRSPMRYGA